MFIRCRYYEDLPDHRPGALCGLRGCKNGACSFSWPEVIKGIPNQCVVCFVSYIGQFFSVSHLCLGCM